MPQIPSLLCRSTHLPGMLVSFLSTDYVIPRGSAQGLPLQPAWTSFSWTVVKPFYEYFCSAFPVPLGNIAECFPYANHGAEAQLNPLFWMRSAPSLACVASLSELETGSLLLLADTALSQGRDLSNGICTNYNPKQGPSNSVLCIEGVWLIMFFILSSLREVSGFSALSIHMQVLNTYL